jgi:hypothetical protein
MKDNRNFLKSGFNIVGGFKESNRTFMSDYRTVCVKKADGTISEHSHITQPWKYIAKVKKAVGVIDAWIKEES